MAVDPLFREMYNKKILKRLRCQYGSFVRHHEDIVVSSEALQDLVGKYQTKNHRRAEVVIVIPDVVGNIWLHTKAFYPEGIYRLMTGGIGSGEAPEAALKRETHEETGLHVEIQRCLAVITYRFIQVEGHLDFVSYVFLTTAGQGYPQPADPGEAISDFRAVPVADLQHIADQLSELSGEFADWGTFRAVSHKVVGHCLNEKA